MLILSASTADSLCSLASFGVPSGVIGWMLCDLIKLLNENNKMFVEVKEEEIYEDLSMMLQLIKQQLALLARPSLHANADSQSGHLLAAFRHKYASVSSCSPFQAKIIERFFCRIREMTGQFLCRLPRHKQELISHLQAIEQFANESLHKNNNRSIASFLDLIAATTHQKTYTHLNVLSLSPAKADITPFILEQARIAEPARRVSSQVQLVEKNVSHYLVMDIEGEQLRGCYFDLKSDRAAAESNATFRNRFIRYIIHQYCLEYDKYRRKEPNPKHRLFCRFESRQSRWQQLDSPPSRHVQQETMWIHSSSAAKQTAGGGRQRDTSASSHALRQRMRDSKMAIDSFRSLLEDKLGQKREVKIKNMVMNLKEGERAGRRLNQRRTQFFKKSQDQVRLRYKYYNYSAKSSKSSIKYRTINPESTLSTFGS